MRSAHHPQLTQADIIKKLEQCGVTTEREYRQIAENLSNQNKRLISQIQSLHRSVAQLKEKQKRKNSQIKRQKKKPESSYQQTKAQLQKKYKQFDFIRKKLSKKMGAQPLNLQYKQYINRCYVIDKQIEELKTSLKDLRKQKRSISKSMRSFKKQTTLNMTSVDSLQEQNKQMKRKIWQLRKNTDQQQSQVLKVQNSLIGNRQKIRRNNEIVMTLNDLKESRTIDRSEIIRNQVQSHRIKTQMNVLPQQGRFSKMSSKQMTYNRAGSRMILLNLQLNSAKELAKEKQIMNNKNKLLLRSLKGVESTKTNLVEELNLLSFQIEERQKPKSFISQFCQTQQISSHQPKQHEFFIDKFPLRRQYFGRQGLVTFDDRRILQSDKKTCIVALKVYQSERGLSCIKATYSNKIVTQDVLPEAYLQKLKLKQLELSAGDFISLMAIKFHKKQRKIMALKVISNEEHKFEFNCNLVQKGDKEHETFNEVGSQEQIYVYDIDTKEWPVCLFGSYVKQGSHWILSSLGAEINDI